MAFVVYDLGPRLLLLRRKKKLTQQKLVLRAKELDPDLRLTDAALGKYENDRAIPRLAEAAAIADVLGVSLDYLANGEKDHAIPVKGLTEEQIEFVIALTETLQKFNRGDPRLANETETPSELAEWMARMLVKLQKKPPRKAAFLHSRCFYGIHVILLDIFCGICYCIDREGRGWLEQVTNRLTDHLLRGGYIESDQLEWCRYAVMRRSMGALSFLVMVLAGALFVDWRAAVLFTAVFRFLRIRTGGYHAKTPHMCLLTALCVQIFSLLLVRHIRSIWLYGVMAVFSVGLILKLAPANNAALHLTREEIEVLRPAIRKRVAVVLPLGGALFFLLPDPLWGGSAIVALAADAVLLVLSAIGLGAQ